MPILPDIPIQAIENKIIATSQFYKKKWGMILDIPFDTSHFTKY